MIHLFGPRDKPPPDVINTTSRCREWRELSPFFLGPVELYDRHVSHNVENAWQFSRVYPWHTDKEGNPSEDYFTWAEQGWADHYAHRYPAGKGKKPLYSWWKGQKLGYIEARKAIYAPLYCRAVGWRSTYQRLKKMYEEQGVLNLWDFDAYDHHALGMSYEDVINCETRKMGHAFVLAMMLDNQRVWECKGGSPC